MYSNKMWSIIIFTLPLFLLVAGKKAPNQQEFLKILFETSSVDNTTSLSLLLSDGTSNLTVNVGYFNEKFHGMAKPVIVRNVKDHESFLFTFDRFASAKISIEEMVSSQCIKVTWESTSLSWPMMDCIPLQVTAEEQVYWFGGAEMFESTLASNTSFHGMKILDQPFYSSDIYASHSKLGGVLEAFWINSAGWRVESDTAPLWISFKDERIASPLPSLCLRSAWSAYTRSSYPYSQESTINEAGLGLNYNICKNHNLYTAWNASVRSKSEKRERSRTITTFSSPNMAMIEEPIWSTWAEFKKDISQSEVLSFAQRIVANNYSHSVLEIDDMWSTEYGDFVFKPELFPDPHGMVTTLHRLGFRVMLWITPFCDSTAEVYGEGSTHRYWVMKNITVNNTYSYLEPAKVIWWDNQLEGSAVLDVTNPLAVDWFVRRLQNVMTDLGIDGFKFDAGETVYIPPLSDPSVVYYNLSLLGQGRQPLEYTRLYNHLVSQVGSDCTEVRAAWKSQELGSNHFVRIMDLDSTWGENNGLRRCHPYIPIPSICNSAYVVKFRRTLTAISYCSVLPRVLLFSILGYPYALPDMVGGNGYGIGGQLLAKELPTAELYIRWIQTNVILPMQLSISPWRFKGDPMEYQVNASFRNTLALRQQLLPHLHQAIEVAKTQGTPIARPMWFVDSTSPGTVAIDDQYMLGEKLIIAPILYPNTTTRSVVLPRGIWRLCDEVPTQRDYHGVNVISCVPSSALNTNSSNSNSTTTNNTIGTMMFMIFGLATCKVVNATLSNMPPCFVMHTA